MPTRLYNTVFPRSFPSCLILTVCLVVSTQAWGQNVPENSEQAGATQLLKQQIDHQMQLKEYTLSKIETLKRRQTELRARQSEIHDLQGKVGISNESFADVIKSLQTQRVDLMIDLAGLNARQQALLDLKEQESTQRNPQIERLMQIIKIEKQQLENIEKLHERGSASENDLHEAQRRLLEVEIRLEEARQPASELSRLNQGLWDTALQRAEKQARLEKTEALLESIITVRPAIEESLANKRQASTITQQLSDRNMSLESAERKLSLYQKQLEELTRQQGKKY